MEETQVSILDSDLAPTPLLATVDQHSLDLAVKIVTRIIPNRTTLPILSHVLIQSHVDGLALRGTNMETMIECVVPAVILSAGVTTLPGTLLANWVGGLDGGAVEISSDPATNSTKLRSGRYHSKLHGLPPDDFPLVLPDGDAILHLTPAILGRLISSVEHAATEDIAHPAYAGINLNQSVGVLAVQATDGYRMARAQYLFPDDADVPPFVVTIPTNSARELARILELADPELSVTISATPQHISFHAIGKTGSYSEARVVSQVMSGKYVNIASIIPKQSTTTAMARKSELVQAIKMCSWFARDVSDTLKITVDGASMTLVLDAVSDSGQGHAEVPADIEGDNLTVYASTDYLVQAIGAISTPQVVIELSAANRPIALRPNSDEDHVCVMMPRMPTRDNTKEAKEEV